jgi:hypothetical protein
VVAAGDALGDPFRGGRVRILDLTDLGPGGERHESHMSCLAHRQALGGHDVTALTSTPHLVEGQTSADAGPVEVIPATSTTMGVRRHGLHW